MAARHNGSRLLTARGATHGVLAALAVIFSTIGIVVARDHRQNVDCPVVTARFDSTNGGALIVQMCATLPPIGGAIIRYDLAVRISLLAGIDGMRRR